MRRAGKHKTLYVIIRKNHGRGLAVILIIKWRRILRINWRSRELAREGSLVRSLVAGARWASVFPSGNHGVRLFVGDAARKASSAPRGSAILV